MYLGAHVGIADGLAEAARVGRSIGAEAIQIFSKSPQMWKGSPIAPEAAAAFRAAVVAEGLRATAIHHGYLANLASPKPAGLAASRQAFQEELDRAERLGVDALILHPGAHLKDGSPNGIARLCESVNLAFRAAPGGTVRLLFENAAGQGTTLGSTFVELAEMLDGIEERERVGIALDTCHLFAAGHDFRTPDSYGALLDRIDSELGLANVRAFHLNDAKEDLGSRRDRHANIGDGKITLDGFRSWVTDRRWASVPGYLETPLGTDGYQAYERDLAKLRALRSREVPAASSHPAPKAAPSVRHKRPAARS